MKQGCENNNWVLTFKTIESGQYQIVKGIKYRFKLQLADENNEIVYFILYQNTYHIEFVYFNGEIEVTEFFLCKIDVKFF